MCEGPSQAQLCRTEAPIHRSRNNDLFLASRHVDCRLSSFDGMAKIAAEMCWKKKCAPERHTKSEVHNAPNSLIAESVELKTSRSPGLARTAAQALECCSVDCLDAPVPAELRTLQVDADLRGRIWPTRGEDGWNHDMLRRDKPRACAPGLTCQMCFMGVTLRSSHHGILAAFTMRLRTRLAARYILLPSSLSSSPGDEARMYSSDARGVNGL